MIRINNKNQNRSWINQEEALYRKPHWHSVEVALGLEKLSAKRDRNIMGVNYRVRIGTVGSSNRAQGALIPAFNGYSACQNFKIVKVSDIWNRRRDEGRAFIKKLTGNDIKQWRNNEGINMDLSVIKAVYDFKNAHDKL